MRFQSIQQKRKSEVIEYDSTFFDAARHRAVPVAFYAPGGGKRSLRKIVIFNHGYGRNQPGSNKQYAYLTRALASRGYFVASIQHELPTDDTIPTTGNLYQSRLPFWQRGVANILFVLDKLRAQQPELDYGSVAVVGHSNGGDMAMLLARDYSSRVHKVISLDNRRVPLPRTRQPRVYSLRGNDFPADPGVLPTAEEQTQFAITIVALPDVKHGEMDDKANEHQRRAINRYLLRFLRE